MKRWLCWLWLAAVLVFLLCIPHHSVDGPHLHQQGRSVLDQSGFVSTCCRALRAVIPALFRSRAGPSEFFAIEFGFSITNIAAADGPRWREYRGPPGPNAGSSQDLVTSSKAAGQAGSLRGEPFSEKFRASGRGNSKQGVLQQPLASFCRETSILAARTWFATEISRI
jgi:hypothetical protein